ncbi:hypothetical protein OD91_0781 [Lutibacter sp. Hel_I_33_5]|uniref:hypothetical protein n=1 Tax=Lutibacter sp. Hel_I_33_5 TaxID=1566289 RepID=UPI0011A9AB9E|nr:hypothetical protein [Lutibacter sp. Hel_I_33_5]TVZ55527.1 hypothetical protein OD91_0781 [Lutibacter sp. Hel_I_33_5]
MKKNTTLPLAFIFACFLISCDVSYLNKDIEDVSWDGNIKIPAGYINYNLSELFKDLGSNDLTPTSTEEFSFSYTESFSGKDNDAFNVSIDDATIESSIKSPIDANDLPPGIVFPYTITDEIAPGVPNPLIGSQTASNQKVHDLGLSQEITGASFDGGTLTITLTSTVEAKLDLKVTLPSFTKKSDNSIYSETITITGENIEVVTVNLNEYNADFTNDGTGTGKTSNTVVIDLEATFGFASGNTLDANDAISYSALLSKASYEVIHGDFKQETFNFSSNSIDLGDFFDNFNDGEITFENVSMSLNFKNDYGLPIGLDLSPIKGTNANSSVNLTYTGDLSMPNTIIIDGVENFGDNEKVTNRVLDKNNSNIGALLEAKPTSIEFGVSGKANPIASVTPNKNFYAATNTGFNAEISIGFDKISLNKTIEFDAGDDIKDFNFLKLAAAVENKIPLGGDLILNFKDSANQIVHTETLTAFKAANVNQSGESDGVAVSSSFAIELTEDEINNISNAKNIDVNITLQLPGQEKAVMVKGSDELNITINLEVGANITSNNN